MEEKILSILSNIQEDIGIIKDNEEILKEDVSGLKEDVSGLKEDVSGLKEDVSALKIDVSVLKKDMSEVKKRVSNLENIQEQILEELRINKLNVAQIMETLNRNVNENKKAHQMFDSRIKRLEKRAI